MATEKILDARELEAPLPLEYAIKIAKELQDGEYLVMLHRMKPCKLSGLLDRLDILHIYFEEGGIHYLFGWKKTDIHTRQQIKKRLLDEYGRTFAI